MLMPETMKGLPDDEQRKSNHFVSNRVILIFLMLPTVSIVPQVRCTAAVGHFKGSPCCSFPCRNGGTCLEVCQGYRCDCTGTNHHGRHCQNENLGYKLKKCLHAGAKMLGLGHFMDIHFLQYEPKFSKYHGGFVNENFNACPDPMLLSPVPEHCPTPLGTAGFQILPPVEVLFDLVLRRQCPTEHNTNNANLLFVVFAQFLANQMWKCSKSNWLGSEAMYGNFARTGLKGKVTRIHDEQQGSIYQNVLTGVFQRIILQEHNRLCKILSQENPRWNDQRLFDTATLMVTGEILTIAAKEWLPVLHNYGRVNTKTYPFIVLSKVPKEIKLALFWPQMFPDSVWIEGARMDLGVLLNSLTTDLPQGGHYQLMKIAATTAPKRMGPRNVPNALETQTQKMILEGRRWKFQSFNNYREYLGLGRLSSFSQLTDDNVVNKNLEKMYGNVDGVEMIAGMLLETPRKGHLLGETTLALISNSIFKAIVTHPLNTVQFKNKFTFGGKTGWNIVKNANLRTLVCNNVHDKTLCEKEGLISFRNKIVYQDAKEVKPCKNIRRDYKRLPKSKFHKSGTTETTCSKLSRKCPKREVQCSKNPSPLPKSCCLPKNRQSEPKYEVCPTKVNTLTKVCGGEIPCPGKRCCVKRPWYRWFSAKEEQKVLCKSKTNPVQKIAKTCARLEPKMESPTTCSQVPRTCSVPKVPCSPASPQRHCLPKMHPAEPKTDVCPVNTEPKTRPEEQKPCPAEKCCVKRPWYRMFSSIVVPKIASQIKTKAKAKFFQKNVKTCAPKMDNPCEPKRPAPQAKKCCGKRAWYRSWQRK